ncbi:MAG TPA: DUF167 domain-containing protein [Gemmatimonadales bacterium]|jgi:uncharacterized protein (TIGR00251 family)|nr:DUF167 domain-containing protein [Gemmatimonadales bacterium]
MTEFTLSILVQPRASRSEIVGPHGDALKVRLAAPPVGGAANEELVRLLAKELDVSRSSIEIVSGLTSRRKTVRVSGATTEALEKLSRKS